MSSASKAELALPQRKIRSAVSTACASEMSACLFSALYVSSSALMEALQAFSITVSSLSSGRMSVFFLVSMLAVPEASATRKSRKPLYPSLRARRVTEGTLTPAASAISLMTIRVARSEFSRIKSATFLSALGSVAYAERIFILAGMFVSPLDEFYLTAAPRDKFRRKKTKLHRIAVRQSFLFKPNIQHLNIKKQSKNEINFKNFTK